MVHVIHRLYHKESDGSEKKDNKSVGRKLTESFASLAASRHCGTLYSKSSEDCDSCDAGECKFWFVKFEFEIFGDGVKLRGPETSNRPSFNRLKRPASESSISSNAPEFGSAFEC